MKPILTIASLLCLALAGPACGKKDDDKKQEEPPAAKQVEEPAPTPEPTPEPAAAEPEVPTPEDFEDEAEQAIAEDGLEKEVEKLEKEVPEPE